MEREQAESKMQDDEKPAFRKPGDRGYSAGADQVPDDRSGYIRSLEEEGYAGVLSRGLRT